MTNIERKNEAFDRLPKAKQRVMIAKDVIKQLKAKKLIATRGIYIEVKDEVDNLFYSLHDLVMDHDASLQETLNSIPQCQVCAKGAIFACTVMRRNQVKNNQVPDGRRDHWKGSNIAPLLGNIFSPMQLRLIETEFEGADIEPHMLKDEMSPNMQLDNYSAEDRLIVIMKNIIRNNGRFRPTKAGI
jgi:hypothetical protein